MTMAFHSRRPMAISAILSPTESAHSSFSSGSSEEERLLPSTSSASLVTDVNHHHHHHHHCRESTSPSPYLSPPLTLEERRLRNKVASARYRAKKNQQHDEMRSLIASLTRENEILQRQLEHVAHENSRLKTTCDRLRGKILAEKMIKRMITHQHQDQHHYQDNSNDNNGADFFSPSS